MVILSFCPGGGGATASPAAVKMIEVNTNHARSVLACIQWVLEAPGEYKIEKMAGEVKPGAPLSGKLIGKRGGTSFTADFDVTLPARDAGAGLVCGK